MPAGSVQISACLKNSTLALERFRFGLWNRFQRLPGIDSRRHTTSLVRSGRPYCA